MNLNFETFFWIKKQGNTSFKKIVIRTCMKTATKLRHEPTTSLEEHVASLDTLSRRSSSVRSGTKAENS